MRITKKRIEQYREAWQSKGYSGGIPDECPDEIAREGLAPSEREIAICLLKNDMHMTGLGFTAPRSIWYSELKRIEISARGDYVSPAQLLFRFMFTEK